MPLYYRRSNDLYTIKKVCSLLNTTNYYIYQWIEEGHLKPIKHGKNNHFREEDILDFKRSEVYQSFLDSNNKLSIVYLCCDNRYSLQTLYEQAEGLANLKKWTNTLCEKELVDSYEEDNVNSEVVAYLTNLIVTESPVRLVLPCSQSKGAIFLANLFRNLDLFVVDKRSVKAPYRFI